MSDLQYSEPGECERCHSQRLLCRTGVCESCNKQLAEIRDTPALRKRRLGELNKSENGIIRSTTTKMLLDTSQYSRERKLSLGKVLKAGDSTKQAELASRERLATILAATPKQLTDARPDNAIIVQLTEINAELIRYIAKHPDLIRDLPPRKYEELIAEILRDHGHTVNLTPATRDGGRDIMVIMKTQYGEMLMIVECKRFKPERKVGLEIVERFLHVLREKERASIGLIATTSSFSLDAKKSAKEYEYLLKLWDFESVKEMTQHYGTWYTKEKSEIWVPNYAAL